MGKLKETVRRASNRSIIIEALWLKLHFMGVKLRMFKSDISFVDSCYKAFAKEGIHFDNPTLFSEKLCILKLTNRNPLLAICSDKHEVRKYVTECGLEHLLKKEYCAVEDARQIDFSALPDVCYIKTTHGSGRNMIYKKNKKFNKRFFVWKYNYLLKQNTYYEGREWSYKNVKPRIVCEECIPCDDDRGIHELQFFCFDGEPKFIMYNIGLADKDGNHKKAIRYVFDMDYQIIPVETSMPTADNPPEKPKEFERMVEYAKKLSKPFPHVRVDLMYANNKVYFGELTFYSGGGHVVLKPDKWKKIFGDYIHLDNMEIAPDAYEKGFKKFFGCLRKCEKK